MVGFLRVCFPDLPWQEAEDVAEDAAIKILRNILNAPSAGKFTAWWMKIVRNTALDYFKKPSTKRRVFLSPEEMERQINAHPPTTEDESLARERLELIWKAVNLLDFKTREMFILRYFWGWSCRDLAAIFNATAGAVRGKVTRAKAEVKNTVKRLIHEEKAQI
jgi:RNA polymerase sigma-70 factor (ECF subfamily)